MTLIANAQYLVVWALALTGLTLEIWALIHCLRTPARSFQAAEKRTKNFWTVLLVVGVAVGVLGLPGQFNAGLMFIIIAVVPAAIYLTDVKPAVDRYPRR